MMPITFKKLMYFSVFAVLVLNLNGCRMMAEYYEKSAAQKYRMQDYQAAIAGYNDVIEADPDYAVAYQYRGLAKSYIGDWQGALADLTQAIALEPRNPEFLSLSAYAYLNVGQYRAANSMFAKIATFDRKKARQEKDKMMYMLFDRADSKLGLGDHLGAIRDFSMMLGLTPNSGIAYHKRAIAKYELNRYKEAISDLNLAIRFDQGHNDDGASYSLRGQAKQSLGDFSGAEADFAVADRLKSS